MPEGLSSAWYSYNVIKMAARDWRLLVPGSARGAAFADGMLITRFHHGNTRTVMFTEKLDCLLVSKLGYKKSLPFLGIPSRESAFSSLNRGR